MKTYYYALDNLKRINHITDEVVSYYETVELTEEQYKSVRLGHTGVVDGQLVEIGQNDYEKQQAWFINTHEQLQYLKEQLAHTDWQVIVNHELKALGQPAKYDEQQLHDTRQAWRDDINVLEQQIANIVWVDKPITVEVVDDVVEQVVDDVVDDILPIQEQTNFTYEDIEAAKIIETEEEVVEDSTVEDTETTFSE
jgi:hypothetical protein